MLGERNTQLYCDNNELLFPDIGSWHDGAVLCLSFEAGLGSLAGP